MIQKRSLDILKLIINNPDIAMEEIELKTNLSRRQIDYSIENINYWLLKNDYEEIEKKFGGKLFLRNNVKDIIKDLLKGNVEYIFNEEERQKIIFLYLYLNYEEISLYHLMDILEVSRGTINDDLKKLNQKLQYLNISTKYSRENGYELIGEESSISYALMNFIVEIISYEEALYIIQVVVKNDDLKLLDRFQKRLKDQLSVDQIFISENNLDIISYIYCFYQIRGKKIYLKNKDKLNLKLERTVEYRISENVLTNIDQIDRNDIEFLTALLLSYSTQKIHNYSDIDLMINKLITSVLERLKKSYAIILQDREKFFEQLRAHIRPAIFRMYFNFPMVNPLKNEIISKYSYIYTIIEEIFQVSNLEMTTPMSADDIAYLTIHFATFISDTKSTENAQITGVIVCPSGIGISVLLRKELSELFPKINFLESIAISEINNIIHEVDVVFSTVLVETDKPLFLVNPVMNNIEKVNLVNNFNKRFSHLSTTGDMSVQTLIKTIERYANIVDEKGLIKELSYLMSHPTYIDVRKEQPMLSEITNRHLVQLNITANDWKEAVSKSAQVLEQNGKITNNYIQSMVKNTEENGPYIVITENVALPHARPEEGALESAIGITTLEKPIEFGHELNDPVKYIFCLSTVDNNSHLRALAELVELLDDKDFYKVMNHAEQPQEIIDYIVEKEQEALEE
jgi:PTS system ascorbate-specific IIA component